LISVVLTAIVRALALRCNVTDEPDGLRKLQAAPVPLWGGVAVFATFFIVTCAAWSTLTSGVPGATTLAMTLMVPTAMIFVIGLVDDSRDLPGRLKLGLQIAAVSPLLLNVDWFQCVGLFNHELSLGYLAWPLTLLWLIGCINAINLLDGMDGSASTVSIVASLAIAGIAYHHGHVHIAGLSLILAGSVAGFLVFNRPPASIYLGDCGSTVIGLLLGALCMEAAELNGSVRLAVPIVVMAVPILDTALAVLRRKLTGRRFDCADRGHIHHRLLERGLDKWQALALIATLSVTMGLAAFGASVLDSDPLAWLTVLGVVVAMTHLRFFGNHEWALVKMSAGSQLAMAASRLWKSAWYHGGAMPDAGKTEDFDEAWQALSREVGAWHTRRLELTVRRARHIKFVRRWDAPTESEPHDPYHWHLSLVFGAVDRSHFELAISGDDSVSAEPWYLPRLAVVLRSFGRYWAARPELLVRKLSVFDPSTSEQREAA
jgi:UDP-GlcNAc:undecaprenyl-phosphate GlcNAc-1-phosphate transferase